MEATTKANGEMVQATFLFKNAGSNPVRIEAIHTSCGCATVDLEKRLYAPGETGELKALFDPMGRRGLQKKTITVVTDEAQKAPTVLSLTVNIPEIAVVEPRLLVWQRKEPRVEKHITVRAGSEAAIRLAAATPDNSQFVVTSEFNAESNSYRVTVKPASTDAPARSTVRLIIETTIGRPEPVLVEARVQ